ncbi:MAG: spermidine synthase [Verrucomicrobia bacterium]|nr:spermidine synthase [Verrucomicrobiota bacterium]
MTPKLQRRTVYTVFFLSGLGGLGCQMIWSRQFGIGLGHEMPAVLAVVAAFFGGLALGAWRLDGAIGRSARPGRWYAALEIVIGVWGLLLTALLPLANDFALSLIGLAPSAARHWFSAFAVPFLALLPATISMGATLPAMERFASPWMADGRCIAVLYSLNTLGAVAGTLASTFILVPSLGFTKSLFALAGLNLLCGVVMLIVEARSQRRVLVSTTQEQQRPPSLEPQGKASLSPASRPGRAPSMSRGSPGRTRPTWFTGHEQIRKGQGLDLTLFATGLLGIGYEVLGVRVMAEVLENTIYSFAAALSVYLLGTSIGASIYHRFGNRTSTTRLRPLLLIGLSTSCLLGAWVLTGAQKIYVFCRTSLGDTLAGGFAAEAVVAALVFGLPTILMGAMFSHLVQSSKRERDGVGRAVALNTLGSALAPLIFGVMLLPALGAKWSFVSLSGAYVALLPKRSGRAWMLLILPLVLMVALPRRLQIVQAPPGGKILEYREGVMDSIAVVEHFDGHRSLLVNNRFTMGGTGAADAARRHAHIPLLLHPNPKRALFLGLGTGITFAAAGPYADLAADGVELIPEIPHVLDHFAPHNRLRPGLNVRVADARRFVRASREQYDVIVADLFHPARDGAGALYTREHFQAMRQRLAPDGVFCQWLPLFQLDEAMLQVIVRTCLEVFPDARAFLLRFNVDTPVLGLIAMDEATVDSTGWFENRVRDPNLIQELKSLGLPDALHLFGCFLAGPSALREFSQGAALNTDDQPVVILRAPHFAYRRNQAPHRLLFRWLDRVRGNPRELIESAGEDANQTFLLRLEKFIQARDVYLRGLAEETAGRLASALDTYLESCRLSDQFSTAYARCLTIAVQQAKTQPDEARWLLQRLAEAQPSRPVANELLRRLSRER